VSQRRTPYSVSAACFTSYIYQLLARAHGVDPLANEPPNNSPGFQRTEAMDARARQSPLTITSARGALGAFWKRGQVLSQAVATLTVVRDGSDSAT